MYYEQKFNSVSKNVLEFLKDMLLGITRYLAYIKDILSHCWQQCQNNAEKVMSVGNFYIALMDIKSKIPG